MRKHYYNMIHTDKFILKFLMSFGKGKSLVVNGLVQRKRKRQILEKTPPENAVPCWHIFVKQSGMTPEQFEKMISVLSAMRDDIGDIKKNMPAFSAFNLDDIYAKLEEIEDALYNEEENNGSIS